MTKSEMLRKMEAVKGDPVICVESSDGQVYDLSDIHESGGVLVIKLTNLGQELSAFSAAFGLQQ